MNHLLGSGMSQTSTADEFEATIDAEGKISVPSAIAERLRGQKVRVRLRRLEIATALAKRDVTEEEIERIASVQLESRNQVVDFLLTEGALSRNRSFKTRVKTQRSVPGRIEH